MLNYKITEELLSNWLEDTDFYSDQVLKNEQLIKKQAEENTLKLFKQAAFKIPAYKHFLEKNNIKADLVKSIKDFQQVPLTTKENYIDQYDIKDRCWGGDLKGIHMISTSSGTTGKPHLWPRDLRTEIEGAFEHELFCRNVFSVDKNKTLFINGFAMGNWIAGTFTLACVNLVAWKGYPITVMTPGYSAEAIVEILGNLSFEFDQIIITGHTPFLKELMELVKKKKIDFAKTKIALLGTGQSVTENWRSYILKLLNSQDYFHTFINLYGSADAALMGFETPFSIYIRKLLSENMDISKKVFDDERLPALYNFDPRITYFEAVDGELCITKYSGCPLIRYNIHDTGGVFSYQQVIDMSKLYGLEINIDKSANIPNWTLPFVYLFGREKFMVKIFGANVYTEHVQHALSHEKLQPLLTGRFILDMQYDKNHNPKMMCRIELHEGKNESKELEKLVVKTFVEEISKLNSEYRDALNRMGDKVEPNIIFHEFGHNKYFPKDVVKKTV